MADDEVEALQGIFCGDREFKVLSNSDAEWSFCICVSCQTEQEITDTDQSEGSLEMSIQCFLPIGYPHVLPVISLACERLTKHSTNQLREGLYEYADNLAGQPMVMDLVYWVQENAWKFLTQSPAHIHKGKHKEKVVQLKGDGQTGHVAILHIDHMRSRVRYIKTLVSWATELSLTGRLLICHHIILVLLLGMEDSIKDFLTRLRTQKVDIDSNGRSCKERMMTVMVQGIHPRPSDDRRMIDFKVCESSTSTELECFFREADLVDVYSETVVPKFNLLQTTGIKSTSKS